MSLPSRLLGLELLDVVRDHRRFVTYRPLWAGCKARLGRECRLQSIR